MTAEPLTEVMILLAGAVFVVALARRLGLPAILGYIVVGMVLGPHAAGVVTDSPTTQLLAELGVVFLLFTLGLEFSFPRMIAMKREVFGLGALQVVATAAVFAGIAGALGVPWLLAVVLGGALSMSSTAIIMHQLTDRGELNRTHGRLSFSMLLFQDLAFVPFLALASALTRGEDDFSLASTSLAVAGGAFAVLVVLAAGRWLLKPLFNEIANSRLRELFTMAVLFVVLASAWTSHKAGLSLALGGFLSGMMFAETEYRHQIETVIRPFRDILLGLFFISVGMLLDVNVLIVEFPIFSAILIGLVLIKMAIAAGVTRFFVESPFKAVRTGIVISIGGEFGIAILTLLLQGNTLPPEVVQPILVALVLSMVLSPFIVSKNRDIARLLLREKGPPEPAMPPDMAATSGIAKREHVILCGFGRVGQNVARVLESQNFEYIAIDLDPARIRAARQAGDPVIFGDSSDEELLEVAGLATASAVVISFSDPGTAVTILHSVRRIKPDVPVLVRTQDDGRLQELKEAGATEVVPETVEASLTLVSQVLVLLKVPTARVFHIISDIRTNRYAVLRAVLTRDWEHPIEHTPDNREELKTVVIPPGAWAVGRTLEDVRARGAEVAFTGIRRQGILGREPEPNAQFREGDIVVIYGEPRELEHAESVMLAG